MNHKLEWTRSLRWERSQIFLMFTLALFWNPGDSTHYLGGVEILTYRESIMVIMTFMGHIQLDADVLLRMSIDRT